MKRVLIECQCNTCGTSFEVFYDLLNDYYICKDCLDNEEENQEEEDENQLPLFI